MFEVVSGAHHLRRCSCGNCGGRQGHGLLSVRDLNEMKTPPILSHKHHNTSSAFTPESWLRETRRQKRLSITPFPKFASSIRMATSYGICVLGDTPTVILTGPVTTPTFTSSAARYMSTASWAAPSAPRLPCTRMPNEPNLRTRHLPLQGSPYRSAPPGRLMHRFGRRRRRALRAGVAFRRQKHYLRSIPGCSLGYRACRAAPDRHPGGRCGWVH